MKTSNAQTGEKLGIQCEEMDKYFNYGQVLLENRRNGLEIFDRATLKYGYSNKILTNVEYFRTREDLIFNKLKYSTENARVFNSTGSNIALEGILSAIKDKLVKLKNKLFGRTQTLQDTAAKDANRIGKGINNLQEKIKNSNDEVLQKPRKRVIPWKMILLLAAGLGALTGTGLVVWKYWPEILKGAASARSALATAWNKVPALFKKKSKVPAKAPDAIIPPSRQLTYDPVVSQMKGGVDVKSVKDTVSSAAVSDTTPAKQGWTMNAIKAILKPLKMVYDFLKNIPGNIWSGVKNFFSRSEKEVTADANAKATAKKESFLSLEDGSGGRFTGFFTILRIMWGIIKAVATIGFFTLMSVGGMLGASNTMSKLVDKYNSTKSNKGVA